MPRDVATCNNDRKQIRIIEEDSEMEFEKTRRPLKAWPSCSPSRHFCILQLNASKGKNCTYRTMGPRRSHRKQPRENAETSEVLWYRVTRPAFPLIAVAQLKYRGKTTCAP